MDGFKPPPFKKHACASKSASSKREFGCNQKQQRHSNSDSKSSIRCNRKLRRSELSVERLLWDGAEVRRLVPADRDAVQLAAMLVELGVHCPGRGCRVLQLPVAH